MGETGAWRAPSRAARIGSVWSRHVRVYCGTFISNVTPALLEPLFLMFAVGLGVGRFVEAKFSGLTYPQFMAAGIVAVTPMWTGSFESTYGTYVRMTFQRSYAAMLATPLTPRDILLGEVVFCGTKGVLFASIVTAVLAAFGAVTSWGALAVPVVGFVIATLFAGAGHFVTTRVKNINHFQFYFTAILTPLSYFSGLMVPVPQLPAPVAAVAYVLPMFHAVETCRMLVTGPESRTVPWAAWCPVVLCAYAVFFVWLGMRSMERRIRG